jgi:hypothetical protein
MMKRDLSLERPIEPVTPGPTLIDTDAEVDRKLVELQFELGVERRERFERLAALYQIPDGLDEAGRWREIAWRVCCDHHPAFQVDPKWFGDGRRRGEHARNWFDVFDLVVAVNNYREEHGSDRTDSYVLDALMKKPPWRGGNKRKRKKELQRWLGEWRSPEKNPIRWLVDSLPGEEQKQAMITTLRDASIRLTEEEKLALSFELHKKATEQRKHIEKVERQTVSRSPA